MKKKIPKRIAPEGSTVVCPYLMVASIEQQMEFLVNTFNATVTEDATRKDGFIQHGEVCIGGSIIMMGRASKDWPARESMNYVYVEDVDKVYNQALQLGATSIMKPADRFYGIREGGFADQNKNQWWVAQILEKLTKEELQNRTSKN